MIIYDKKDKYLVIPIGLGNLNSAVVEDEDPCEGIYEDGYEDGYEVGQNEGYETGKTEGITEGYNSGYTEGKTEGYAEGKADGKTEGVDEYKSTLETLDVVENGTYTNFNYGGSEIAYKKVNVNVPVITQGGMKYFDGTVDYDGLKAIGWDDDDIMMLQDNANFYSWQNEDWEVSSNNKALYGVINADNIGDYKDRLIFCPMFDTSGETDFTNLFRDCNNLKGLPALDTSQVTNMYYMFDGCTSLITIPALDTSKVMTMHRMFGGCESLTSIPALDTSKVMTMSDMFNGCESLTSIPALDTSQVTTMNNMFNQCTKITSIPALDTSQVTDMDSMFNGCESLTTIPSLDTSQVTNMMNMFQICSSLTTIPSLDTSQVTNMTYMFQYCKSLTSVPSLDCSNVTNTSYMFGSGSYNAPTKITYLGGFDNLKVSLDLSRLPNLTSDSVHNVFDTISSTPNEGATIFFNSNAETVMDAVDPTKWDAMVEVATGQGWTITIN